MGSDCTNCVLITPHCLLVHGVQRRMISVDICFVFCFVVAICDHLHAVEVTYGLPEVLTTSGNLPEI